MFFTGFADEAAQDIQGQIAATRALGWQCIEMRGVNGAMMHALSDEDFEAVYGALQEAGIRINCIGSAIANWSKKISEPFDSSLEEARRIIPRMQRLGCRYVRVMSFTVLPDRSMEDQMAEERFRRLRELVPMFGEAGITMLHENCDNYGGMGWRYTIRLLEAVPGMSLVFDTGNPVFTPDYDGDPDRRQSAWDFYEHVRDHIDYVHIKDGVYDYAAQSPRFTWPGEGEGDVRRIVTDLLQRGYDGGFSMEPHIVAVADPATGRSVDEMKMANYIEYGRRFMQLIDEVCSEVGRVSPVDRLNEGAVLS